MTKELLNLNPDELLTTARSVRRRLDLSRPVEREVIEECMLVAQQAPTASNRQDWHFVVVTDKRKREEIGTLWRRGAEAYLPRTSIGLGDSDSKRVESQQRIRRSVLYLAQHIHEVPMHVIPCFNGRTEGLPAYSQAAKWGSIFPATWSFMLALRARGLGSTITTFHLAYEEDVAKLLGIPFKEVTQAALLPVAYTKGTDFKRAKRGPVSSVTHWNAW